VSAPDPDRNLKGALRKFVNHTAVEITGMQKHILIADDNMIVRDIVKTALAAVLDIDDCQEAANGREAIERAEQARPDLIILDVGMPEMDGVTAAHRLKESMPEIPIILLTVYVAGQDTARKFGVDAVVSKQEGWGKLSNEVESLLSFNAEKLRRRTQVT
jgi:CheY-like chemotaxis protein